MLIIILIIILILLIYQIRKNIYKEKYLDPEKGLKKEQQEVGQKLAAVMEEQRQAADVLETVFINRTQDLLVTLVSTLGEEKVQPPGFVDQYNALVKFLEDSFPEVANEAMAMIEDWKKANEVIYRELSTEVAVSKPSEKMLKGKRAQSWWSKMTKWLSDVWSSIKQSISNFYSNTVPKIEDINSTLETFITDLQTQEKAAAINKSLKIYLK